MVIVDDCYTDNVPVIVSNYDGNDLISFITIKDTGNGYEVIDNIGLNILDFLYNERVLKRVNCKNEYMFNIAKMMNNSFPKVELVNNYYSGAKNDYILKWHNNDYCTLDDKMGIIINKEGKWDYRAINNKVDNSIYYDMDQIKSFVDVYIENLAYLDVKMIRVLERDFDLEGEAVKNLVNGIKNAISLNITVHDYIKKVPPKININGLMNDYGDSLVCVLSGLLGKYKIESSKRNMEILLAYLLFGNNLYMVRRNRLMTFIWTKIIDIYNNGVPNGLTDFEKYFHNYLMDMINIHRDQLGYVFELTVVAADKYMNDVESSFPNCEDIISLDYGFNINLIHILDEKNEVKERYLEIPEEMNKKLFKRIMQAVNQQGASNSSMLKSKIGIFSKITGHEDSFSRSLNGKLFCQLPLAGVRNSYYEELYKDIGKSMRKIYNKSFNKRESARNNEFGLHSLSDEEIITHILHAGLLGLPNLTAEELLFSKGRYSSTLYRKNKRYKPYIQLSREHTDIILNYIFPFNSYSKMINQFGAKSYRKTCELMFEKES